jgi:hypothetical protein
MQVRRAQGGCDVVSGHLRLLGFNTVCFVLRHAALCCGVLCAALQPVGPNTLLGELVDRNQRALFLFYDEWVTPSGYTVGGKVGTASIWQVPAEYQAFSIAMHDPVAALHLARDMQSITHAQHAWIGAPCPPVSPAHSARGLTGR